MTAPDPAPIETMRVRGRTLVYAIRTIGDGDSTDLEGNLSEALCWILHAHGERIDLHHIATRARERYRHDLALNDMPAELPTTAVALMRQGAQTPTPAPAAHDLPAGAFPPTETEDDAELARRLI